MLLRLLSVLMLTVFNGFMVQTAAAQNRYALIIGNKDYQQLGELSNPVNDAVDMGKLMAAKGFEVEVIKNATLRQMEEAIARLSLKLHQKEAVGLFYYAGHGVAVDGNNYLLPVNANIETEADVKFESVDAGRILENMQAAGNDLNMLILDACRDNPFKHHVRSLSRGLAPMQAARGSLILYAASAGEKAADGDGRNGLFTQYLINAIKTPQLKVEEAFKKTALDVYQATEKKQLPWQSGVILGDFYFTPDPTALKAAIIQADQQAEVAYWNSIKDQTNPDYFTAYLKRFGDQGLYSELAKIRQTELQTSKTAQKTPVKAETRASPIEAKVTPNSASTSNASAQPTPETPYWSRIKTYLEGYISDSAGQGNTKQLAQASPQTDVAPHHAIEQVTDAYTGMQFIYIKPGCFQMGSEEGIANERPAHQVCLKKGFYLGRYEVTQAQWRKMMGNNPINYKECNENCPVANISWLQAQTFLRKLTRKTGHHYRLPSEAEWEYAARAGSEAAYAWGSQQPICEQQAANGAQFDACKAISPGRVGRFSENAFGLYDMHGNVAEWVADCWQPDYQDAPADGSTHRACNKGALRTLRGGAWNNIAYRLRSTARSLSPQAYHSESLGFRVVRDN